MARPPGTLVLDNDDSFTWNLVHLLEELGDHPHVVRSSHLERSSREKSVPLSDILDSLLAEPPPRLLISPGPGDPTSCPVPMTLLTRIPKNMPVLGVCLGQQCLAAHAGVPSVRAPEPVHGKAHEIQHDGDGIFEGLSTPLLVTRYHSLIVPDRDLPETVQPTAWTTDPPRIMMGLRFHDRPWEGVQFHPEAFLTEGGPQMLRNFLSCP